MEPQLQRKVMTIQYQSYVAILREKGVEFTPLSDEELSKLPEVDLSRMIRVVRDLGRTPLG